MEQMNKDHGQDCKCPACACPMYHKNGCAYCGNGRGCGYGIARWVLGVLLLVFIFSCGLWFGRAMSAIHYGGGYCGSGYRMMGEWKKGTAPMMYGAWQNSATTPTAPVQE